MKIFIKIFVLSLLTGTAFTQDTTMAEYEVGLETLLKSLREARNDNEKATLNNQFKSELHTVLQHEEAFSYPFSKLKTVGIIDSPDKEIRIVNWNIEQDDQSQIYYCFVIKPGKKSNENNVIELKDISPYSPGRPADIVNANEWYGALYYKIIPIKKGAKTVYTLLGWDGNTTMSNIKLIDALYFTGNTVKLGSPIFKVGKETYKRMYYEHSEKTTMSLKYEDNRQRIIFDHLSPESPSMKGFYSFYVPDFSYDAFVLDGNKWVLREDVIGVNDEKDQKKQIVYVMNERTGKVEKKEIKVKWQDPSDAKAPAGGNEHIAVTPESDPKNVKSKNGQGSKNESTNLPQTKKDKRDPSDMSTFGYGKKKRKK